MLVGCRRGRVQVGVRGSDLVGASGILPPRRVQSQVVLLQFGLLQREVAVVALGGPARVDAGALALPRLLRALLDPRLLPPLRRRRRRRPWIGRARDALASGGIFGPDLRPPSK